MKTKFFLLTSMTLFVQFSYAGVSAKRDPNTSYLEYLGSAHTASQTFTQAESPTDVATSIDQLDYSNLPEVSPMAVQENFVYVRDYQFLKDSSHNILRRSTWMYPDDGCYARAELMAQNLEQASKEQPVKVFAFGNLTVRTKNSQSGAVSWWYHVAIAYKSDNKLWVLDPSLEPSRPVTIQEWGNMMGLKRSQISFAICSVNTYDPERECNNPEKVTRNFAISDQSYFLKPEWERLLTLKRSPQQELGDQPPWAKK